jgi:hypothetical protein
MWTVPAPPKGFTWRLIGGPAGTGIADLQLAGADLVAASVVRWGDGWAFLPGPVRARSARDFRPAPTRGRALHWAGRWAAAHRPALERLAAGPAGPPGLDGPFRLTPPAPWLGRGQKTPEDAFWSQFFRERR